MTVIVTTRLRGLSPEAYEHTAAQLRDALRAADGFVAHAAAADDDGVVVVTEIWRERDDWRQFFASYVEPNLPHTVPPPTVVEARSSILR